MRRMRVPAPHRSFGWLAAVLCGCGLSVIAGSGYLLHAKEAELGRRLAAARNGAELGRKVSESASASIAEPKLTLRAPRQLFLRPRMPGEMRRPSLDVEVSARLEDLDTAENLEDYYCLEEVWDWDDDTESVYEPDCDPYEEGSEIETFFFGSHRFSLPGTYRVWLRLQRSGETVIAGNVIVRIRN